MKPLRLLQITDCHLGNHPGEVLLGMNTDQSLYDVLDMIQAQEAPDMLIATGDISNDGGPASYERFTQIIHKYFPNTPLAWLPGNHDDPLSMDQVTNLPIEAHYQLGEWNLIFLDSRIPMEEGGALEQAELMRLDRELSAHKNRASMIFLHHQPVPVGSVWLDGYVVKNADEFFRVVDRHKNVKAICWGHVHQEFEMERNGVKLFSTPSTCVQFAPNQINFKVDRLMPGYRVIDLYPNGRFITHVKRIKDKVYTIDFASTGY
jgi:3',5'-cyclic-AMP phosphodiesterase